MSGSYEEALVRLGAITSIDVTRLAPTTLSSIISHIRTLQRNHVEISRISLGENPIGLLDSLHDLKGRPLSADYKRQIGMTIKRLYPDLKFSLSQYKTESYNSETKSKPRRANSSFFDIVRAIIKHAAEELARIDADRLHKQSIGEDLSIYDTCLAILITSCTSLRINEIYDLQMQHIDQIRNLQPVSIHSKGGKSLRNIVPNELLLKVFVIIERNRERCVVGVNQAHIRTAVRAHYVKRLKTNAIILSSVDFMRKRLRELAASIKDVANNIGTRSLGFNMFRNFVSSVLSEGGGHEIAQSLNNHSNVNTTLDHYTVVGPSAAEATFSKLNRLMDEIAPIKTADLSPPPQQQQQQPPLPSFSTLPERKKKIHPYETPMSQDGDK